ncbi:DUF4238 domain-containing protein [Pedobacter sp. P351]|uniref:DUF4238 domain-containing protein n=1 Tax=Pedobacter superstes TaxID=3133441 RepID=UPI0030AB5A4B
MAQHEPVNHHYVSKCHLKEFFNSYTNKIYLYDKNLRNFYTRPGISKIFSCKKLNNRLWDTAIDRTSMELELRVMFEENFSKHLNVVIDFIDAPSIIQKAYEDLNFLGLMALVGEYRNPFYKSGLDDALNSLANDAKIRGAHVPDELEHPDVIYKNLKGYIDVASMLLQSMDPITFSIVVIKSTDHFILPDTTAFLVRQNFDTGKVMQFGIPVSDKMFVLGRSEAIGKRPTRIVTINENDDELVFKINSDLVNYAYKTVACKDEVFLHETIEKMKKVRFIGQYFFSHTI